MHKLLVALSAVIVAAFTLVGPPAQASLGGSWDLHCQGDKLVSELTYTNRRARPQTIRLAVIQTAPNDWLRVSLYRTLQPGESYTERTVVFKHVDRVKVRIRRGDVRAFREAAPTHAIPGVTTGDCWHAAAG